MSFTLNITNIELCFRDVFVNALYYWMLNRRKEIEFETIWKMLGELDEQLSKEKHQETQKEEWFREEGKDDKEDVECK